ncbi:MAG: hypothetical protein IPL98_16225 [Saprospiraceae bacterium]|nr:hypothetical protein [Saprospiraceae bacterium]
MEIESLNADQIKTTELISISQQQKDAELKMADLIAEGKENSDEYQQLSAANSRLVSVTRSLQSQINNTKEKLGNNYVPQAHLLFQLITILHKRVQCNQNHRKQ